MKSNKTSKGKVVREVTVVDEEGVVKSQLRESYVDKEPDFIKLYLKDLVMLNDIPKWVSGILFELLKRMEWSNNEIVLNSSIKKRIALELNITAQTIDNALGKFVKKNILKRLDSGIYQANPFLFGRGSWENIRQIRLSVTYDKDGKHFEVDTVNVPHAEMSLNGIPEVNRTQPIYELS